MGILLGPNLCLDGAWGFLYRWHDNLSANRTARAVVLLIVCLSPLHTAAVVWALLGTNFVQLHAERGSKDNLRMVDPLSGWDKDVEPIE